MPKTENYSINNLITANVDIIGFSSLIRTSKSKRKTDEEILGLVLDRIIEKVNLTLEDDELTKCLGLISALKYSKKNEIKKDDKIKIIKNIHKIINASETGSFNVWAGLIDCIFANKGNASYRLKLVCEEIEAKRLAIKQKMLKLEQAQTLKHMSGIFRYISERFSRAKK